MRHHPLLRHTVGMKIGLVVATSVMASFGATIWFGASQSKDRALASFDAASMQTTVVLADSLAASVRFVRKEAIEGGWTKITGGSASGLIAITALDAKGRIITAWHAADVDDPFAEFAAADLRERRLQRLPDATLLQVPVFQTNGEEPVGVLLTAWSHQAIEASIRHGVIRQVEISAGLMIGLVIVLSLALRSIVTRPLAVMAEAMQRVVDGYIEDAPPSSGRTDELGVLARALARFQQVEQDHRRLAAKRAAEALEASEERLAATSQELQTTLSSMDQGLMMIDAETRVAVCNRRAIEMFNLPSELMALRPTLDAVPPLQWVAAELHQVRTAAGASAGSFALPPHSHSRERELPNGLIVAIDCAPLAVGDGWVVTCQDITARRHAEQQMAFLARHDPLTALPNRAMFRERLELAVAQSKRAMSAAVLFLDLDHFKSVNDTLGHPVGDAMLCAVADRLLSCVRQQVDMVARFGGDEFAVIQAGPERIEDVAELAQRISDELSRPYQVDGHQAVVGVSIGIALVPEDGSDPDTLLKNADIALYRAKAEGRGVFRYFKPAMNDRLQERRTLEFDLRRGLANHEFELFYQPLVDSLSGRICGFEALMRWNHPTRGLLNPDTFISISEEMGLIVPLGRWALREACREAATWPEDVKVAVNLSATQFGSHDLVQTVADALAESGLPARRLNLEITESVLLQDTKEVLSVLHELRDLGASISMDDFGTGYSSLSYLRSFPFDKIKIDQSFIRDLAHDKDAAAIVRAVTGLGNALGMATTAEGVETHDQFVQLQAQG